MRLNRVAASLFLTSLVTVFIFCAEAGVPEVIHPQSGSPIGWESATAIPYVLDPGALGRLTSDEATQLVEEMMYIWESVPTASIGFESEGELSEDVNETNFAAYMSATSCDTNSSVLTFPYNPIIFDNDGKILENLIGVGASDEVGGLSALRCFSGSLSNPTYILQGLILLNGVFLDGKDSNSPDDLAINVYGGIILHELGHFLGLDHSAFNGSFYNEIDSGERSVTYSKYMSVMYPIVLRTSVAATVLKPDELSMVSALYPKGDFIRNTGGVEGNVLLSSGGEFRKGNVVARSVDDPLCEVYATVSGRYCTPVMSADGYINFNGETCKTTSMYGDYKIRGLEPGEYTIEVNEIPPGWIQNGIFPYDVQATLPGDAEFYNENDNGSEDPFLSTAVRVSAGGSVDGLDIVIDASKGEESNMDEIPLSTFTEGSSIRCHVDTVNYAAVIGVEEIVDLGDEANDILANASAESPMLGSQYDISTPVGGGESGGGCEIAGEGVCRDMIAYIMIMVSSLFYIFTRRFKPLKRNIIFLSFIIAVIVGFDFRYADATSWVPIKLDKMVKKAGRIFAGKCVSVEPVIDEQGLPVTEVTYEVQDKVKGDMKGRVTFRIFGIYSEGNGMATGRIIGMPDFSVGREDVLFLYPESEWGLTAPVGIGTGVVRILRDEQGKRVVDNPFSREAAFSGSSRRTGGTKSDPNVLRSKAPISIEHFLDVIRKLVEGDAK